MLKFPKIVEVLSNIEKFDIKDVKVLNDSKTSLLVSTNDRREYYVFGSLSEAKKFAAKMYIHYEDDPQVFEDLTLLGTTIEEYAPIHVDMEGVERVLSYDGINRIKLTGNSVAYRII